MTTPANPVEETGSETQAPEAAEEVNPKGGEETPEKPTGETPESKEQPEPPEDPENQEHDWKKRFDGVSKDHKQLSEKHSRVLDANVKLAEKNPEFLETLAETDSALADEVSEKLHGKSYKEYKEESKLESLKESEPERYEKEKRLKELEDKEARRIEDEKTKFLESKGIKNNEFDPSYKKVQAQLDLLNPKFVESNPSRALEIAHGLAFPENADPGETKKDADLAGNTSKKGGMSGKIDHGKPARSPESQAFGDKLREMTTSTLK